MRFGKSFLLIVMLFLLTGATAAPQDGPQVLGAPAVVQSEPQPVGVSIRFVIGESSMTVNGETKPLDSSPVVNEGRTMLPVRYLAEAMGAEVKWDSEAAAATIVLGPTTMVLWPDKPEALVNGVSTFIDPENPRVFPVVKDGRTLLPVRFIAETLGVNVDYNQTEGSVVMSGGSSTGSAPAGWFRVRGIVRSSRSGEPLAGAQLTAVADKPPVYTFHGTTGEDGTFSMDLPATSSFGITLTAPGYETKTWRAGAAGWLTIVAVPISPSLSQAPGDGYFRIYGYVKDQDGNPVSDVCVTGKPGIAGGKESYYLTDASGFYFIDWPKWKEVTLKADKNGYSSRGVKLLFGPLLLDGEGGPMIVGSNPNSVPLTRMIEQLPQDSMVQQELTVSANQTPTVASPTVKPAPAPTPQPVPQPAPRVNYGLLQYSSYTAGSVFIFLDGRFLGTNPLYNVQVAVGWHRLRVVTPGGMVITDKSLYMPAGGTWRYN